VRERVNELAYLSAVQRVGQQSEAVDLSQLDALGVEDATERGPLRSLAFGHELVGRREERAGAARAHVDAVLGGGGVAHACLLCQGADIERREVVGIGPRLADGGLGVGQRSGRESLRRLLLLLLLLRDVIQHDARDVCMSGRRGAHTRWRSSGVARKVSHQDE